MCVVHVYMCMHACVSPSTHVLMLFGSSSCTFEGSHDELSTHLEICSYEKLKGFLGRTNDHIQQLQDELKKKDEVSID